MYVLVLFSGRRNDGQIRAGRSARRQTSVKVNLVIIAYHAIFTTYGTWLPNDPRGSFSKKIYNDELRMLGEIEYGRQFPQPTKGELRKFWTAGRPRLSRAPYFINERIRPIVANAFADVVNRLGLILPACAILNDHVHILVMRAKHRIEYLVNQLKGAATRALGLKKTPWSRGLWKIFINDRDTFCAAAEYICENPGSSGLPPQNWEFVDHSLLTYV